MLSNPTPETPDYTERHAHIAAAHGFHISREHGTTDYYRKEDGEGGFWLATTSSGLSFDLAPPDNQIWFIGRFLPGANGEAQNVVHEAVSIETALAEHARIPVPDFDIDGDPVKRHFETWLDLAWHGRTDRDNRANRAKAERVLRSMGGFADLLDQGFRLNMTDDHDGDIVLSLDDEDTGTAFIVTNSQDPNCTHPSASAWSIIRFRDGSDGDECIGVNNTAINEIVARYRDIPVPVVGQEEYYMYLNGWDDLDAYVYETGAGAHRA